MLTESGGNAMPIWSVKATWIEDDADMTEHWEANAGSAADAVRIVSARLRFHPHHAEARLVTGGDDAGGGLPPNEARRVQPE